MAFSQFPQKGGIPSGNTASRPSSPVIGDTYYNGELAILEIYTGTTWVPSSAPAGTPSVVAVDVGTNRAYGSGQATVTITPGTNGGPASSYNIRATDGTNTYTSGATTATTVTLNVGNSGTYNVTATGSNNFGTSTDAANYSVAITTVPQAPTLSASVTPTTITFTVGGSNGGKAISNFEYSTNGSTYTALSPAQTAGPIVFTGLTQGTSYTYYIRAINANGTGTATSSSTTTSYSMDYLVVGGGGGSGGYYYAGGGGGGQVTTGAYTISPGVSYTLVVGAGGAQQNTPDGAGYAGSDSYFHTFKGAYGGGSKDGVATTGAGGAAATSTLGGRGGGTGADSETGAGGGGGAGAAGTAGSSTSGGNGGNGTASSITGTSTYYGGGGGGSGYNDPRGSGGQGGGGNGTRGGGTALVGSAGTDNTGGGGGGASHPAQGAQYGYGYGGGSGVVILKIPSAGSATFSSGTSSSVSTAVSGYKIYTVTAANGTVTFS